MTPDFPPYRQVRANLIHSWISLRLDLWSGVSGGNKPEKGLQIIIALHFFWLWSLGVSKIQIWNNNVLKQAITWIRHIIIRVVAWPIDADRRRRVSRLSVTLVLIIFNNPRILHNTTKGPRFQLSRCHSLTEMLLIALAWNFSWASNGSNPGVLQQLGWAGLVAGFALVVLSYWSTHFQCIP